MPARRFAPLVVALAAFALAGCGGFVPESSTLVKVTGKVAPPPGKSVGGYSISFQPAGPKAQPAQFPLAADGGFSGELAAGTYTYFLAPGKPPASEQALESFPEAYRRPAADRTVEVKGGEVQLKF